MATEVVEKRRASRLRYRYRYPVIIALCVGAYTATLYLSYAFLISPTFEYLGYRFQGPSLLLELFAWLAGSCVAFALPRQLSRPSAIVLWIIYVVALAPSLILAPIVDLLSPLRAFELITVLAVVYVLIALAVWRRGPARPLPTQIPPVAFWIAIAVFSLITYGLLTFTGGLSFRFVGIQDVYGVRASFSHDLARVHLLSYLIGAQSTVINPLLIANGLLRRKPGLIFLGVLGQALIYSSSGYKTVLFSVPAILVLAILFYKRPKPSSIVVLLAPSAVILIAAAIDLMRHSAVWTSLFTRRFLVTPGWLTSAYVSFFSSHPQAHLSSSILSRWETYPYHLRLPNVIGNWLLHSPKTAANVNLFGDGFANFGWLGVVGAGIVLAIYLRVLDRVSIGIPVAASAIIMVMPAISISNASILTSMFSHGLVAAVVVLAVAPRTIWSPDPGRITSSVLSRTKSGMNRVAGGFSRRIPH